MNKFLWSSSFALATAAFLTACVDETTNVSETMGPTSVAKFKDLDECTTQNEGTLVYAKDSAAVYLCSDSNWSLLSVSAANGSNGKDGADGKNGADGKDGKNGTSCTATALKDSSGYELTCGDKVIGTISNGKDGLKGENGRSCEGKANEDGSVTITCDGKEVATLKNGKNGKSAYEKSGTELTLEKWLESQGGKDGKDCAAKSVEGGVQITCGDLDPVIINEGSNGKDGSRETCRIADDKDGVVTLECGEGESAKVKLYKATCGDSPYDPKTRFCYYNDEERAFSVHKLCGGKTYVPGNDSCDNVTVLKLCKKDCTLEGECTYNRYDEEYQECKNGLVDDIVKHCGSEEYTGKNKFCAMKGETVMGVYKKVTIGTEEDAQTWMAENLNYETAEGSFCYGETTDDPKTENCTKYGRLYTWDAAINNSTADDNGNIQGICPDGWHLPSETEFEKLITYLDPSLIGQGITSSDVAGKPLMASTGWFNGNNGTNTSGFTALPAGRKNSSGSFEGISEATFFWSTTEGSTGYASAIYLWNVNYRVYLMNMEKIQGFSVRCIKD